MSRVPGIPVKWRLLLLALFAALAALVDAGAEAFFVSAIGFGAVSPVSGGAGGLAAFPFPFSFTGFSYGRSGRIAWLRSLPDLAIELLGDV